MNTIKINSGIQKMQSESTAEILKKLMVRCLFLQIKYKIYIWDITGPNFTKLHTLFQNQYTEMELSIDEIASRIRTLGFFTIDSFNELIKSPYKEVLREDLKEQEMLSDLLIDHASIIKLLRANSVTSFIDKVTEDFLSRLMKQHEKMTWIIESHILNLNK